MFSGNAQSIATSYVVDGNNGMQATRLEDINTLLIKAIGGVFPPDLDISSMRNILDIGCGSGAWANEVAFHHSDMQIVGIDNNSSMVSYALACAATQGLDNVVFETMDVTKDLKFHDDVFDLVHLRFAVGFLHTSLWPFVLKECLRVLKRGGVLLVVETEIGISNSVSLQHLQEFFYQALSKQERSFSVDGQSIGIVHMLGKLLHKSGFASITSVPFLLNASYASPLYYLACKEIELTFELLKPFLLHACKVEKETYEQLQYQLEIDTRSDDFACMFLGLSCWGIKP